MEDTALQQANKSAQLPESIPQKTSFFLKKFIIITIIILIIAIVLIIYSSSKNISTLKQPSASKTQTSIAPTISTSPTLSADYLKTHEIISPDGKNKLIKAEGIKGEGIISVSINGSPFKNTVNFSDTNKYIYDLMWSNDSLKIGFLATGLDSQKSDFYTVNADGSNQKMVGSYLISKEEEKEEGVYIISLIGFNNKQNEMYFIKETALPAPIKGSLSILNITNGSIEKRPAFPVTKFSANIMFSLDYQKIYSTDFFNIYEYNISSNKVRTIYSVPKLEVEDYEEKRMKGVDLSSMLGIVKISSNNELIFKYLMYPEPDKIYSLDLNSLDVKPYRSNK